MARKKQNGKGKSSPSERARRAALFQGVVLLVLLLTLVSGVVSGLWLIFIDTRAGALSAGTKVLTALFGSAAAVVAAVALFTGKSK